MLQAVFQAESDDSEPGAEAEPTPTLLLLWTQSAPALNLFVNSSQNCSERDRCSRYVNLHEWHHSKTPPPTITSIITPRLEPIVSS
jgi:hypothetical protein